MTGEPNRPLGMLGRTLLVLALGVAAILVAFEPLMLFLFLAYAGIGAILAIRVPRNSVGWLLVAIGLGFVTTTIRPGIDVDALATGTSSWPDFLGAWLSSWSGTASYAALLALTVVFPSGNLPAGRSRVPSAIVLGGALAAAVVTALAPRIGFVAADGAASLIFPNRLALLPQLGLWSLVPADGGLFAPVMVLLIIGVVSMVVRYWRSSGILRLQLRWLAASFSFVVLAVLSAFAGLLVAGDALGNLVWIPAIIAYTTVPIAMAVAVTRFRLYEIDRIISRTIAWAVVSGLVISVFAAGLVALQAALVGITQGQTLAVAASTLVAFALFQPIRRRVQAAVDRRFDRASYDAEHTVDAFGRRLRAETDIQRVTVDLHGTARAAVAPATFSIWLRARGNDR